MDTLLLPGSVNLLSVTRLAAAGNRAVLDGKRPAIHFASGEVVQLQQQSGLYWLQAMALASPRECRPPPATGSSAWHAARLTPLERHAVLGHLNQHDMRRMGQLAADEELPFCEHCALGKSKRKAVPQQAAPRQTSPGQLTHTDPCAPWRPSR